MLVPAHKKENSMGRHKKEAVCPVFVMRFPAHAAVCAGAKMLSL
jgi:hypothetical protein